MDFNFFFEKMKISVIFLIFILQVFSLDISSKIDEAVEWEMNEETGDVTAELGEMNSGGDPILIQESDEEDLEEILEEVDMEVNSEVLIDESDEEGDDPMLIEESDEEVEMNEVEMNEDGISLDLSSNALSLKDQKEGLNQLLKYASQFDASHKNNFTSILPALKLNALQRKASQVKVKASQVNASREAVPMVLRAAPPLMPMSSILKVNASQVNASQVNASQVNASREAVPMELRAAPLMPMLSVPNELYAADPKFSAFKAGLKVSSDLGNAVTKLQSSKAGVKGSSDSGNAETKFMYAGKSETASQIKTEEVKMNHEMEKDKLGMNEAIIKGSQKLMNTPPVDNKKVVEKMNKIFGSSKL